MELEKFWILAESAWNDPNINKAERAQTFDSPFHRMTDTA